MLETMEARAELRQKLETLQVEMDSLEIVNMMLELLDMVEELSRERERLENKVNVQKSKIGSKVKRIEILENNLCQLRKAYHNLARQADWLAEKAGLLYDGDSGDCGSFSEGKSLIAKWWYGAQKAIKEREEKDCQ